MCFTAHTYYLPKVIGSPSTASSKFQTAELCQITINCIYWLSVGSCNHSTVSNLDISKVKTKIRVVSDVTHIASSFCQKYRQTDRQTDKQMDKLSAIATLQGQTKSQIYKNQ